MKVGILTLALLLITTVLPLYAQDAEPDDLNARLLACDKFTDPAERLECFNAITGNLKTRRTEMTSPPPPPAAAPKTPEKSAATPAQVEAPKPAAEAPKAAVEAPEATVEAATDAVDEFGRDGMTPEPEEKEKKRDETFQAVIVGVREHYDRRFSVELDNGQVWRETEGSRVGIPRVGRSVEVKRGSLGGYRMKIEGIPRLAWVRRLK